MLRRMLRSSVTDFEPSTGSKSVYVLLVWRAEDWFLHTTIKPALNRFESPGWYGAMR